MLSKSQKHFEGEHKRCKRNRKRSKRRGIYCPIHKCYIDSVSQKIYLYTDKVEDLKQRGISKRKARLLITEKNTVILQNEWLEAFWCNQCSETEWYHIQHSDRSYHLYVVSRELWQQAIGVTNTSGNPSVGEFTRRQARILVARDN